MGRCYEGYREHRKDRRTALFMSSRPDIAPRSPLGVLVAVVLVCGVTVPELCVRLVVTRQELGAVIQGQMQLRPWQARRLEAWVPEVWEVHCGRV